MSSLIDSSIVLPPRMSESLSPGVEIYQKFLFIISYGYQICHFIIEPFLTSPYKYDRIKYDRILTMASDVTIMRQYDFFPCRQAVLHLLDIRIKLSIVSPLAQSVVQSLSSFLWDPWLIHHLYGWIQGRSAWFRWRLALSSLACLIAHGVLDEHRFFDCSSTRCPARSFHSHCSSSNSEFEYHSRATRSGGLP